MSLIHLRSLCSWDSKRNFSSLDWSLYVRKIQISVALNHLCSHIMSHFAVWWHFNVFYESFLWFLLQENSSLLYWKRHCLKIEWNGAVLLYSGAQIIRELLSQMHNKIYVAYMKYKKKIPQKSVSQNLCWIFFSFLFYFMG